MATWDVTDLSRAMESAVRAHAMGRLLKQKSHKLQFNGFWRNGDDPNVCLWLNKATWHDAKTGEGGGCKEFAKTAFNMSLSEFMNRYGTTSGGSDSLDIAKALADGSSDKRNALSKRVDQIFKEILKRDSSRNDPAKTWLENERGFKNSRLYIGSGFANLTSEDVDCFESQHRNFIRQRLAVSDQIVVPLRGIHSDEVQCLFFRSIGKCGKSDKSRLLPNVGGWTEEDGTPRVFGFPHLIHNFPSLLICEGMADYFAAECLLDCNEKILPLGASSADGIIKLAHHLINTKYSGVVLILHQLDKDEDGELSTKKVGPSRAINALKEFKESNIRARIFDWPFFLQNTTSRPSKIADIADALSVNAKFNECSFEHLQDIFLLTLTKTNGA